MCLADETALFRAHEMQRVDSVPFFCHFPTRRGTRAVSTCKNFRKLASLSTIPRIQGMEKVMLSLNFESSVVCPIDACSTQRQFESPPSFLLNRSEGTTAKYTSRQNHPHPSKGRATTATYTSRQNQLDPSKARREGHDDYGAGCSIIFLQHCKDKFNVMIHLDGDRSPGYGHSTENTPVLVRSPKLSSVAPG